MKQPTIRRMLVAAIKPAPDNPRKISPKAQKALRESLRRWGLVEPLVWNERTGHIVGGHQRLELLCREGVEEVDVVVVDLPPADERALNLTLNNPGAQGTFTDLDGQLEALDASLDLEALALDELLGVEPDEDDEDAGLEPFLPSTDPRPAWILVSAPPAIAADIELAIRARWGEDDRVKYEISFGEES
ncbi:MAG: ParB N-terminal domain-containing protein [Patescibacteria group bacterium]|jgi:hypothetical protein